MSQQHHPRCRPQRPGASAIPRPRILSCRPNPPSHPTSSTRFSTFGDRRLRHSWQNAGIHERRRLHPCTQRPARFAQSGKIEGQITCDPDIVIFACWTPIPLGRYWIRCSIPPVRQRSCRPDLPPARPSRGRAGRRCALIGEGIEGDVDLPVEVRSISGPAFAPANCRAWIRFPHAPAVGAHAGDDPFGGSVKQELRCRAPLLGFWDQSHQDRLADFAEIVQASEGDVPPALRQAANKMWNIPCHPMDRNTRNCPAAGSGPLAVNAIVHARRVEVRVGQAIVDGLQAGGAGSPARSPAPGRACGRRPAGDCRPCAAPGPPGCRSGPARICWATCRRLRLRRCCSH